MRTVAEIKQAIETLPPAEVEVLAAWLQARRQRLLVWPVPSPDVPKEELLRIQAEIDSTFSAPTQNEETSLWQSMKDLVIQTDSLPADLASNKAHLKDYGKECPA